MRFVSHLTGRERTALLFCVAFMIATLVLSTFDQRVIMHHARSIVDPNYLDVTYTGTIVIPVEQSGQCRYTQFNNRTIELKGSALAECYRSSPLNQPGERMNSLRNAFNK